jgi:dolichol-phosphate mannosyltransferase
VAVVVPTYNERENLESVVGQVRTSAPDADLLIVDDNSPDGTGELADKLAAKDSHVHVMHRAGKSGLGAAYIAGFQWALGRDYGAIVEMDADGSHQPQDLPKLLTALGQADLVVGSRWIPGGKIVNWPRNREILSRGANIYVRLMLGIKVRDATGGYRAYRVGTLRSIPLDQVVSQGYCFQVDLTLRTLAAGLKVTEVPITFVEREHGASKMTNAIVREAFVRVAQWGIAGLPARLRGRVSAPSRLRALALHRGGGLRVPRAITPLPDDGQPLGQHLFQVGDGPALHQHVPVGARRLGLLLGRQIHGRSQRGRPAYPALPHRRNLRLGGERNGKVVALGAVESHFPAWSQVSVAVVLVARRPEPGTA